MIEKINLQLATFETEAETIQARQDIIKGMKTPFWKWIVKVLKENEEVFITDIMEGRMIPDIEQKAKAFVNTSRMLRELPNKQLEELKTEDIEEDEDEDFFQEDDPYNKTEKKT